MTNQKTENGGTCLGCLSDDLCHTCGFTDPLNPFNRVTSPAGGDA